MFRGISCVAAAVSGLVVGCTGSPSAPEVPTGQLQVAVTLRGLLPSRTASIVVDDTLHVEVFGAGSPDPSFANSVVAVLPQGVHRVRLSGLEPNCEVPPQQEVRVLPNDRTSATFTVRCMADGALAGIQFAHLDGDAQGWGNSFMVLLGSDGTRRIPDDGWDATGIAWSDRGDRIAAAYSARIGFFDDQGAPLPGGARLPGTSPAAIAWVPGRDAISLLELSDTGCNVRLWLIPLTSRHEMLPCAGRADLDEQRGDMAWSPDGGTVAVSSRSDGALSLTSAATGSVVARPLPDPRYTPIAVAWAPRGGELAVAGLCAPACTPDRIALFIHEAEANRWREVSSWPTNAEPIGETLEFLDPHHLVIGPVSGVVMLVPLHAPAAWRPLIGGTGWRFIHRPGGN